MAEPASTIARFAGEDSGATAIEYGLIAGLITVALIAALIGFGDSATGLFDYVVNTAGAVIASAGS